MEEEHLLFSIIFILGVVVISIIGYAIYEDLSESEEENCMELCASMFDDSSDRMHCIQLCLLNENEMEIMRDIVRDVS